MILTVAGPLPALIAAIAAAFTCRFSMGQEAALAALAYLLLPLALYYFCLVRKLPWQRSMQVLGGFYVALVLAIFLIGRRALGPDPFAALAQGAAEGLNSMVERDYFLDTLYRFGLLGLPEEIAASPLVPAEAGGYTFSPEALEEFYKQITARMDLWLRSLLPTLACSYSVWFAVVGPYISHHYGLRHARRLAFRGGEDVRAADYFEGLGLPDFSRWHIPKQIGYPLLAAGALSLFSRLLGSGMMLTGQMFQLAFSAFFGIQGLALINHLRSGRTSAPLSGA